ncbi:hypothetical protein M3Y96_00427100 [Aphelenchoides besseyi]|nr:hypothetical protein M3Y96_00427100 [Aphelenchoides besseyi]
MRFLLIFFFVASIAAEKLPCFFSSTSNYSANDDSVVIRDFIVMSNDNPGCGKDLPVAKVRYDKPLRLQITATATKKQTIKVQVGVECSFDVTVVPKGLVDPSVLSVGDFKSSSDCLLGMLITSDAVTSLNQSEKLACEGKALQTTLADRVGWLETSVGAKASGDAQFSLFLQVSIDNGTQHLELIDGPSVEIPGNTAFKRVSFSFFRLFVLLLVEFIR